MVRVKYVGNGGSEMWVSYGRSVEATAVGLDRMPILE